MSAYVARWWPGIAAGMALLAASPATAGEVAGWRTDGSGRYPQADPPHEWGADKNVVWRTRMPAFSNALPVIVGERIFLCSEPCVLLCVNKADGKVLWQRESSYQDLALTPEVRRQLEAEQKQAQEWRREQAGVEKEMGVLRKAVADSKVGREAAEEKLARLKALVEDLKARQKSLPLASRYTEPGKNSTGGYSPCTPVSDGKHVWVAFGNGLVACYDLDGKRRWLRLVEHSTAAYGHAASPRLAGGRLLVHYADLVGLDPASGEERWRVKLPPNHGTPALARVGGVEVAITPTGSMVRAADGKVLADKLGSCGPNSPIVHDGTVYFISGSPRAARLPAAGEGEARPFWKGRLRGGDYWFPSPVLHEGLIYALNGSGSFSVLEADTGQVVYERRLDLGGRMYPSLCLAGKLLLVSSDNGVTVVLEPGREYRELRRNTLEPFRSTPVFEGKRMYVRTLEHLYCIGK